jgi:hypothetical protein
MPRQLEVDSQLAATRLYLGLALLELGDLDGAEAQRAQLARDRPDEAAELERAIAARSTGRRPPRAT